MVTTIYRLFLFLIPAAPVFLQAQPTGKAKDRYTPIEKAMLEQPGNFYYIDGKHFHPADPSLPIGVFDSGTGGLTILDALVKTSAFSHEQFVYLADQANMPYGNYYSEHKTDLLIEHVLKDAQFFMSDKYYADAGAKNYAVDKKKVKAIVIACNTATAYGKEYVEDFLRKAGIGLKVIGVIDAGAKGVLESLDKKTSGSIGVFATVGTIASKGYEQTILRLKDSLHYTGDLVIFNQGGQGVAEAVDGEPDFISTGAAAPRNNYRGPSLDNPEYRIDKALMDIYRFDFDRNKMLCDTRNTDDCQVLQLNSTDNYVRYHLVSLLEKIRKTPAPPLKVIVLGCTHYPYLLKDIRNTLADLYAYKKDGKYIYRDHMAADIHIIDPAVNVARELRDFLLENHLFNQAGDLRQSEFYITVPNIDNPSTKLDAQGRFTYDYKYGRKAGEIQEYVKIVPFSRANIPSETLDRLKAIIPATFHLIRNFDAANSKLRMLNDSLRIGYGK